MHLMFAGYSWSQIRIKKVNIGARKQKHILIIDSLLATHAVSGCDTIRQYHGLGKKTVIKVLQSHPLLHLLDPDANQG